MKLLEYALVRARTQPLAFTAGASAILILAIVAVTGLVYLISPMPPYGFYYDLGVDILATSTIAHFIHSFADLKDALGWAGWGDRSAFAYAPMVNVAIAVFFAKLVGDNGFEAVKIVQLVEVLIAALSAWWLYQVLRGKSLWAWTAAAVYALLAQQLLMIRGDLAFGFTAALAPAGVAAAIALVRRCGIWALPLCAALASLFGAYFATEHLFLQSLPVYAFAVVLAYDARKRASWALFSAVGFVILFASIAFEIVPTLASAALFTPPATLAAAHRGGEFATYQNGPLALLCLCMNEFIVNGRAAFSLGWLLAPAGLVGIALWILAIWRYTAAALRRTFAWGEAPLAVIGLVCIVLSTGGLIPGVSAIWWVISQVPVINNIRTPDRFIAVGVIAIVMLAVAQLEQLSHAPRSKTKRNVAACAIALPVVGLALFFVMRVLLGDTQSVSEKEPHLAEFVRLAQTRGNRTANLALVDKGSVFDTSLYGMPMPFVDFQSDLSSRYEGDGIGGAGMLARADVATIFASPPWTNDSPLLGQSAFARAVFLNPLGGDATTVTAYGVDRVRGYVRGTFEACIDGGPGLLDNIVAMPAFADTAFIAGKSACSHTVYADSAPLEVQMHGKAVRQWNSIQLFPHSGVMRDIDYRATFGRFFINVPWYRNAIEGDSPIFSAAAVSLDEGDDTSAPFSLMAAGAYSIAMHAVCHADVTGLVQVDGIARGFSCKPAAGFQWIDVPVGMLNAGAHTLTIRFSHIGDAHGALATTWTLAFDGAAVVRDNPVAPAAPPSAFVFSASRFAPQIPAQPDGGKLTFVSSHGMQNLGESTTEGGPSLLARIPTATATYRWGGLPGAYRVWVTSYVESGSAAAAYVAIGKGGSCCLGVTSGGTTHGAVLYTQAKTLLRPGDLVRVYVHETANDTNAIAQLLSVVADPDPMPARPLSDRSAMVAEFDFISRSKHLNPFVPTAYATAPPGHTHVEQFNGIPLSSPLELHVTFPAQMRGVPTLLHVVGDFGDHPVRDRLSCGDRSAEGWFNTRTSDVALPPSDANDCSVTIASTSATPFSQYVQSVSVSRPMSAYGMSGERWLRAGTYRIVKLRRGGADAGGRLSIDGRPAGALVTIARDGRHALQWNDAPSDAYLLAFVPTSWPVAQPSVNATQIASVRWRVALAQTTTLETAVYPDGYWALRGNGAPLRGHRCDLENTCFDDVPAGTYTLEHAWPSYIKLGFLVTALAWIAALVLWLLALRQTVEATSHTEPSAILGYRHPSTGSR